MRAVSVSLTQAILLLMVVVLPPVEAQSVELDGLIEPYMVANVGSGVRGIIETVDVDRGDFVKKGQVVATLQSGVEKATRELARIRAGTETTIKSKEAQLAFSERKEKRYEELYKKETIPFGEMDEAETSRMMAELELQEARDNKRLAELELQRTTEVLERLTIRSPITGVVVERFLSPGEFVEEQPIFKIAQIDPLNVEVVVPVDYLGRITPGMRAEVTAVVPDRILTGPPSSGLTGWQMRPAAPMVCV